jgi:hypothetical protein
MALSVLYCDPWPSAFLTLTGDLASASNRTVRGGVANLTVAGLTTASSVSVSALSNAGTTINTTLTPSGGSFSGPINLPPGIHDLTITAGTTTRNRRIIVPYHIFGINGHPDYDATKFSPANWATYCGQIGAKTIRMNSYNNTLIYNQRMKAIQDYQDANNTGITLLPSITVNPVYAADGGTEDSNFTLGYNTAFDVATRVPSFLYCVGNELFSRSQVRPDSTTNGERKSQFQTAGWVIVRGLIRGMIAGVKAVRPNALIAVNFVNNEIAAADMCWHGTSPDGTADDPAKAIQWDVTDWHNYRVFGSMFGLTSLDHGAPFNLMAYLANTYGKPIIVTEFGHNQGDSDSVSVAWFQQELQKFYDNRYTYNIWTVNVFQADGDYTNNWGVLSSPTQPAALKAIYDANPDT